MGYNADKNEDFHLEYASNTIFCFAAGKSFSGISKLFSKASGLSESR